MEGIPRCAHGPNDELGKAKSADDVSKLKDGIPIGASAVETPMATLAKGNECQIKALISNYGKGLVLAVKGLYLQ